MSEAPPHVPRAVRRVRWILVAALLFSSSYFCQAGDWHQNARFAQVRAVVETGSLAVNRFIRYRVERAPDAEKPGLQRAPLADDTPRPGGPEGLASFELASYDLSYHDGRLYPNKAPGVTFLAVPSYWIVAVIGRLFGADPDGARALTASAHWTAVLSSGILSALGSVLFLGISRRLYPDTPLRAHALAALTLGLATLTLPFSSMLYDHVAAATFALAAFAGLLAARDHLGAEGDTTSGNQRTTRRLLLLAGLAAGISVTMNYAQILAAGVLGIYAWARMRRPETLLLYGAGVALPLLLLLAYHQICFGAPFTTANQHQLAAHMSEEGRWLGLLGAIDPRILFELLVGPYRGLFYSSPILALALVGFPAWLADRDQRPEAAVCTAIFLTNLLMNASFIGWHSGGTIGPRYLIPAIPFLALTLAPWFHKRPVITGTLAAFSAATILLATAVDPQPPGLVARPYPTYLMPLARGEIVSYGPYLIRGPVSANRTGIYEGDRETLFDRIEPEGDWAAFNMGELIWPRSLASLVPWLLAMAGALYALLRSTAPREPPTAVNPPA